MRSLTLPFTLALLAPVAGSGSNSDAQRPLPAGWGDTFELPAFDSSQGQPAAVRLTFQRLIAAEVQLENLADSPSLAEVDIGARFRLSLPGFGPLAERSWMASASAFLGPFDGMRDAAGPSGIVLEGWDYAAETITIEEPAHVALFCRPGGGTVGVALATAGIQRISAPPLVASAFDVRAGARLSVSYEP
jgi:hypothetical protein